MKNEYIINGNTVRIRLTRKIGGDLWTTISLCDLPKVQGYPWTWNIGTNNGGKYIFVKGSKDLVKLHRYILDAKPDEEVDHKDRNPLNNTRDNIRICNRVINSRNKSYSNSITKQGVWSVGNRWRVTIGVNGKRRNIGTYSSLKEAIEAREQAEKVYWEKEAHE